MSPRARGPNLRRAVVQAAKDATVELEDYERAQVLGQVAALLAAHPKIRGEIAFKGGAIMHLVDGSPRLSRDLDGVMASARRVTERTVREALSTDEAKRVVLRVDKFVTVGKKGIRFPIIACRPLSGVGEIAVTLSIHWDYPLHRKPGAVELTIAGRKVVIPVVERIERLAEKVRAFIDRGLARDAFDLHHQNEKGLSRTDLANLAELVPAKLREDDELPADAKPLTLFNDNVAALESTWARGRGLVMTAAAPAWEDVKRSLAVYPPFIPVVKPN
jgi:Domain of unknown function (DUF1814).